MSPYSPLTWTVASLVVFALASNIDWLLRSQPVDAESDALREARRWVARPNVRAGLFGTYMAGIPMLALLLNVPTPSQIGLPGPPLIGAQGWDLRAWRWPEPPEPHLLSAPWIVLVCALVCIALLLANQLWLDASLGSVHGLGFRKPSREQLVSLTFYAILFEAHWALFRAGTLSVGLENRTLTMFLALGFLALEAWSSPANRRRINRRVPSERASRFAAFALLSASVFYFTGNSLFSAAAHWIASVALVSLAGRRGQDGPGSAGRRSRPLAVDAVRPEPTPKHEDGDFEPTIV